MFVGITNTPRDYAWGQPGGISRLFDSAPVATPEAELWLGAHPGSPARIIDPTQTNGATDLAEWIASDPGTTLGDAHALGLPFLLKVLSAESSLSLQAHPTPEQAAEGFARENAAGIPLDAPHRNYKDPFAKPELILAVSERFDALCGFRPTAETREALDRCIERATPEQATSLREWRDRLTGDDALRDVVEWLISGGPESGRVVQDLSDLAASVGGELETQRRLAELFPGDPGIAISLLLHEVHLSRGEALYLPAGNIHAYLHGTGIELMSSSDNVLRGGLTPKHVDVPELLSVLDFTPRSAPYLVPEVPVPDVRVFRPDVPDFELIEFEGSGLCPLDGPAIALCVSGSFELRGVGGVTLSRGESVYITPDEGDVTVAGSGLLVIATTGSARG